MRTLIILLIAIIYSCSSEECQRCIAITEANDEQIRRCKGLSNNADIEPWTERERQILANRICDEVEANDLIREFTLEETFRDGQCTVVVRTRVECDPAIN